MTSDLTPFNPNLHLNLQHIEQGTNCVGSVFLQDLNCDKEFEKMETCGQWSLSRSDSAKFWRNWGRLFFQAQSTRNAVMIRIALVYRYTIAILRAHVGFLFRLSSKFIRTFNFMVNTLMVLCTLVFVGVAFSEHVHVVLPLSTWNPLSWPRTGKVRNIWYLSWLPIRWKLE